MIWEVTRAEGAAEKDRDCFVATLLAISSVTVGLFQQPPKSKLKLCSTIDKEILDDEDLKGEETDHLCLFNLWEGHENPLPSLFAH